MAGDRLFVSYAGEDREKVSAVVDALKARGVDHWYDRHAMGPGDDLVAGIDAGLKGSRHVVLFASTSYFAQPWTQLEYSSAVAMALAESGRQLFIVRLDDTPIPPLLSGRLYITWEGAETVAATIAAALGRVGPAPAVTGATMAAPAKTLDWKDRERVPDYLIDVLAERLLEVIGDLRAPGYSGATVPVTVSINEELTLTMHVSRILIKNDAIVAAFRNTWRILEPLRVRAHRLNTELMIGGLATFEGAYEYRLKEVQDQVTNYMAQLRNQLSALASRLTQT